MKITKLFTRLTKAKKASFTIKEVAKRLNVSGKTVYRWLYEHKIKGVRPARYAGQWRISESEVVKIEATRGN